MAKKKFLMYIGIVFLILIIFYLGYLVYININYNKNIISEEFIPEEELSDENLRQTIITLYFMDTETATLMPEARKIDAKKLLENPYKLLVELLIEGPKNEKLIKIIPEDTKINDVKIINGIVNIDFSKEFIENQNLGKAQEELIINSILKTLKELTEVKGIKILINGEENKEFPDGNIKFSEPFI